MSTATTGKADGVRVICVYKVITAHIHTRRGSRTVVVTLQGTRRADGRAYGPNA